MADIDSWVEAQEFQITLDANGRIIDYWTIILKDQIRQKNEFGKNGTNSPLRICLSDVSYRD